MMPLDGKPGDRRGFLHKRIFGAIGGFLGGGGPIGGIKGFLSGGSGGESAAAERRRICLQPGITDKATAQECRRIIGCPPGWRELENGECVPGGFGPGVGTACQPGTIPDPQGGGFCISPISPFGQGRTPGNAVMGRHGAALEPDVLTVGVRRCIRGMVLGNDGLCYNKRDISNKDRQHPRGRRPLLTGGEMRCISIASRAARKLETKEKQLRKMGMLKPLPKRGRQQRQLAPGHHAHVAHD